MTVNLKQKAASPTGESQEDPVAAYARKLKSTYFPFSQEMKVFSYLDRLLAAGNGSVTAGGSPDIMTIWGPSRSGKTSLALNWAAKFPPYEEVTGSTRRDIHPILYVRAPGKATMKALFKKILVQLNADLALLRSRQKDEFDLAEDIGKLLKKLKVRLVIIDELHHLLERTATTELVLYHTTNALKVLADDAKIPFVFIGLPKANLILESDAQIAGRVKRVVTLTKLNWNNEVEQMDYCGFIMKMEEAAALPEASYLFLPEAALRIYAVTGGLMGKTAEFIIRAAIEAFASGAPKITPETLIDLVDTMPGFGPENNPFRSDAQLAKILEARAAADQEQDDEEDGDYYLNVSRGNRRPDLKIIMPK